MGALALDESTGFYAFQYDPGWARTGIDLAPFSMPPDPLQVYRFPALPIATYHRLPAAIADSLPDAFGNAITNAYLASEGVDPAQITPLDRLAYLGSRGVGALEYRPPRGPRPTKPTAIELANLVTMAREALAGNIGTRSGVSAALRQLIAVGTSAGGARAKALVALNPETGELRSGQVPADPGFEHWLLKLDGIGPDSDLGTSGHYGRIEYAYHLMAVDAGVEMTECLLLEEGERAHFVTRRFDRAGDGAKIHAQTLCAIAELDFNLIGAHDYAQLFLTAGRLGLGSAARAEVFRRMVFNVVAANCDDHTKNFSFILPEDGQWTLAPAYDVTHAYSPNSRWTRQHLMAVNSKTAAIAREDILEVADRFEVPSPRQIIDQVLEATRRWSQYAERAGLPGDVASAIAVDIDAWSRPVLKSSPRIDPGGSRLRLLRRPERGLQRSISHPREDWRL